MALAHAIMAALVNGPQSGYDLTKYFERSLGFFWKASHQQIYRELTKLEEQGWIQSEEVAQIGRPDKKLYQLQETGQEHLTQWLTEPCEPVAMKDDLLVKLYVGYLVPNAVMAKELGRQLEVHRGKLAVYQAIEQQFFQSPQELSREALFPYLTLRRGIRNEQEWIDWCEESLALLANNPPG